MINLKIILKITQNMLKKFTIGGIYNKFKLSDDYTSTIVFSIGYFYGGVISLATIYGIKKGIQLWLKWKIYRSYRKITIGSIEAVVNIEGKHLPTT